MKDSYPKSKLTITLNDTRIEIETEEAVDLLKLARQLVVAIHDLLGAVNIFKAKLEKKP